MPEVLPEFAVQTIVGADAQDVTSIIVAAQEEQWLTEEKALQLQIAKLDSQLKDLHREIDKAGSAQVKTIDTKKDVLAFQAAAKNLGFGKAQVSVDFSGVKEGAVDYTVTAKLKDDGYCSTVSSTVSVKPNAKVKTLLKQQKKLSDERKSLKTKLSSVSSELASMGRHERKAKAMVALTNLQKTEEGKKFLAQLNANVARGLPAARVGTIRK
jgi:chaperonin cofactor prefoldin